MILINTSLSSTESTKGLGQTHISLSLYIYIYVYIYIYIYMCVYTHTDCMFVLPPFHRGSPLSFLRGGVWTRCLHFSIYVCINIYTYTYKHIMYTMYIIHIRIYIYIYIYIWRRNVSVILAQGPC